MTYTVGVTVSGLVGSGLTLQLNGGDDLEIAGNGSINFSTGVASGASYAVTVKTQPSSPSQVCTVSNGAGTIGSVDVTNVAVACVSTTSTIGVIVSGLINNGLVLQLNGSNSLPITANGSATFPTALSAGTNYTVSVGTQPQSQSCTVSNGTGTVGSTNVTNVGVICSAIIAPAPYTLSVNVTGLTSGSAVVLQLNGSINLPVAANGNATFPTQLASLANYSVTVLTQPVAPPTQTCTVTDGMGTGIMANVTNIPVTCVTPSSVTANVAGLAGSGLSLVLNGAETLPIVGNGLSAFATQLSNGASYSVTIGTQPSAPNQTCTLGNASGTVGSANFGSVTVICPLIYATQPTGDWTWMSLSGSSGVGGVGTQGVPSPLNYPDGRNGASSWTDQAGNLWLFGGQGFSPSIGSMPGMGPVALNDLWKYDPRTGAWEWVSGLSPAVFGTPGVPSTTNEPHPTNGASSWTDQAGNLWLFGGDSYNDLWKYTPSAGTWEWVSGSDTVGATGVYGTQGKAGTGNVPGTRFNAASWIDATGALWLFGGYGNNAQGHPYVSNDLWKFDPSSGLWTWVSGAVAGTNGAGPSGVYGTLGTASANNVPGGRSSPVSWTDAAGNWWLFGGSGVDSAGSSGALNDLWKYNPAANTWTWVGGSNLVNAQGVYGTQGMAAPGNMPGARAGAVAWIDSKGAFWLFGGQGNGSGSSGGYLNDLWRYSPSAENWTWIDGSTAAGSAGLFGSSGVPAPGNNPGARSDAVSWTDPAGNLWLFGGWIFGYVDYAWLDDLWVYTPAAP
jgi:N-acetylneuraminic acid mutarotase